MTSTDPRASTAWTEDALAELPVSRGFRLRGLGATRLETFVDAAFAFAMTMVVITVTDLPSTFTELVATLKGAPAFAASFSLIMLFWFGHRNWSRRFGLEDGWTISLSLGLIFVVLIFVYPLKMMFSAFFSWLTGGWLPSEFAIGDMYEMVGLFAVYGVGYGAMAAILALLNRRALAAADRLALDPFERVATAEQVAMWSIQATTGFASAAFAGWMPPRIGVWAGFVYCSLFVTTRAAAKHYRRLSEALADG